MRSNRLFVLLALGWLLVAGGTAAHDWPTPARLSEERLRQAFLLANALDKSFRPYDTPLQEDRNAQYQDLVAGFTARFGKQFDVTRIEEHYENALTDMAAERIRILLFTVGSTVFIWWLLWTIRRLLGRNITR